jgi:predicted Zn-ribbon and HTH transcriptional regulator
MSSRELIELRQGHGRSLREVARAFAIKTSDLEDDLQHLPKSLRRNREHRAHITPAHCRNCAFVFHHDKLDKADRYPRCRHTWIEAPLIAIARVAEP